jgi:WD40 repeat protein
MCDIVDRSLYALSQTSEWKLARICDQGPVEIWMGPNPPIESINRPLDDTSGFKFVLLEGNGRRFVDLEPFVACQKNIDGFVRPWLYDEVRVRGKNSVPMLRLYESNQTCHGDEKYSKALERFLGQGDLNTVFHRHRYGKDILECQSIQKAELLIEQHREIVGSMRHFLAEEIAKIVEDADSKIIMIQGEPGMGKTSLMSYMIRHQFLEFRDPAPAYFFFRRLEGMTSQDDCYRTIYAQVSNQFQINPSGSGSILTPTEKPDTDIYVLLTNLLYEISVRGLLRGRKLLIFIDALDEADKSVGETDMSVFRRLPSRLPPGVFLVLSTRPVSDASWFASNPSIHRIDLNDVAYVEKHVDDGVEYLNARLKGVAISKKETRRLSRIAAGNFLFLSVVCNQILHERLQLNELHSFIDRLGLQEGTEILPLAYEEFWGRLEQRLSDDSKRDIRIVAGILASVLVPVNREFVNALLGPGSDKWNAALTELSEYLVCREQSHMPEPPQDGDLPIRELFFGFFHKSFADFIKARVFDATESHGILGRFCFSWELRNKGFQQYYSLRFGPAHLNRSGQLESLLKLLANPRFLESKAANGMLSELCVDLTKACATSPEGKPHLRIKIFLEAILSDISFLARHPEALLQTLHSKAWWYDCRELEKYYDNSSAIFIHESKIVSSLIDEYLPKKAWVRSLRPPQVRLHGPQRMVIHGHGDGIETIAVHGTQNAIAASAGGNTDRDTTIRIWELDSGSLLTALRGHRRLVHRIRFDEEGKHLLSSSADGSIAIWDIEKGQRIFELKGHGGNIDCVAWNLHWILSGARDGEVRLWRNDQRSTFINVFKGDSQARGVAFHPNGELIACGFTDGFIRFWSIDGSKPSADGIPPYAIAAHSDVVYSLAFSKDGKKLASGSRDGKVKIWDCHSGRLLAELVGHNHWVYSVAFSPDGKLLASGSRDETVRIWRVDEVSPSFGEEEHVFVGHKGAVYSVAFRTCNERDWEVVSGGGDGSLRVWNSKGAKQSELDNHSSIIRSICFSPDGTKIVSGSGHVLQPGYHSVRIWDAANGVFTGTEYLDHKDAVLAVACSNLARVVVSGSRDRTVRVWNSEDNSSLVVGHPTSVHAVAINPQETHIASGSMDGVVRVWRVGESRFSEELRVHRKAATAVAFHPFSPLVVSGGMDGTCWLHNLNDGTQRQVGKDLGVVLKVAFSKSGKFVGCICQIFDAFRNTLNRAMNCHRWVVQDLRSLPIVSDCSDLVGLLEGFSFLARVDSENGEIQFSKRADGQCIAIFPSAPEFISTHPSGGKWACVNGRHLLLLEAIESKEGH